MPGKRGSAGGGGGGELPGAGAPRQRRRRRKVSCFSSIQLFLVSECALMLAQGTVGAYLPVVKSLLEQKAKSSRFDSQFVEQERSLISLPTL
ncbi:hypothetical protein DUI87_29098 [Hirundo rustica rustica]|uniref:Uncharacterized protein n=1 Tax=Hirundo rustica rustica TaxID=333673 RepID=A0A3M0IYB5_HIRRU|nr:hypothetical protein DUI87_29098 [Hirundo rustica rustica]